MINNNNDYNSNSIIIKILHNINNKNSKKIYIVENSLIIYCFEW